ncbi:MAG: DUF721 domain-containing protein [Burkholderiales bacterium]|nr:DUF721 domain-containing protein [Burkholderiales bacterium]
MSTSSSPPYRINIKRGRKPPGATGIAAFLSSNDKISPLLPTLRRNAKLQKDCGAILPPIFASCEVMQLAEGQLTLSAPNAALATKLKQQCPKLQENLQERGWQINAIRIKVQVRRTVEKAAPEKQLALPGRALQAFDTLEHTLEDTPQNAALRAALQRLVRRHQGPG